MNSSTTTFSPTELTRYARHFSLPQISTEGQHQLKQARVLCVGAGGLGSPTLMYLAAAGVGTLGIIDGDTVELSNLQRQILFDTQDISKEKALAAQCRLQALNPEIIINAYPVSLTENNAFDIIKDYDIVVDGTDNYPTRYLINDVCFYLKKPNVFASIFQFEGQCSIFTAENGPCYRCLYDAPPPPGLIPDCAEGGVLGVLPGLMGTIQATEVVKLILDIGKPLIGRLLLYDALSMQFRELPITTNPQCRLCGQQQPFSTLPRYRETTCAMNNQDNTTNITPQELATLLKQKLDVFLLDVREPHEYDICHLDAQLIPLKELVERYRELDPQRPIIVYCKMGGRGQRALEFLQQQGFTNIKNLEGGILRWIKEIDNSMTAY
jgi:molybdopterin/thiamine biosynthesis adenylyltransferase/rhodanese-related sulfurtransferase